MATHLLPAPEVVADDARSVGPERATVEIGLDGFTRRTPGRIERMLTTGTVMARWVVVVSGGASLMFGRRSSGTATAVMLLTAVAVVATVVDHSRRRQAPELLVPDPSELLLEVLVTGAAVAVSGGLTSPVVLAPALPLVLVGHQFARHRAVALACLTTTVGALLVHTGLAVGASPRTLILVLTVDGLSVALGVCVRIVEDAYTVVTAQQSARIDHLSAANQNLIALHEFARSMTTSLDLSEVLQDVETRVGAIAKADYITFYVRHDATGQWVPELTRGARPPECTDDDLPSALRRALHSACAEVLDDRLRDRDATAAPMAGSGLYVALRREARTVGLLAIEHDTPGTYDERDARALDGAAEELALSVDNALWFARLRTIGAEAERVRIARDLHDRIAQSLAYASFELERLATSDGAARREEIQAIHSVVHGVAIELRDTLFDLRATVTDEDDLASVAGRFVLRLEERHGVRIRCHFRLEERLPVVIEVELWRIVQEALQNFVRHAGTDTADLTIEIRGGTAHVSLHDRGRGFVPRQVGAGHFGLVGMRERADAIGARLGVESRPQHGTLIRIDLEVPR